MLSVIIPTLNEEQYLPRLLDSLEKQTYKDFEIIVSDSNSQDTTVTIAKNRGCRVIIGDKIKNPGMARNQGATVASGDILLFLDADVSMLPEFIENFISEFKRKGSSVAIPSTEPVFNEFKNKVITSLVNFNSWFFQAIRPIGFGYCLLVKRDIFEKIGGFNEKIRLGEDVDFVRRAVEHGTFHYLAKPVLKVSFRRFEHEGYMKMISKTLGSGIYQLFKDGVEHDHEFLEYNFGHYKKKKKKRKRIAYGLSGLGKGYTLRNIPIIEKLSQSYAVDVYTNKQSHQEYKKIFSSNPYVTVYKIPGFTLQYVHEKISLVNTALANAPSLLALPLIEQTLKKKLKERKYALFIFDYEFFLSRAAAKLKVPKLQINHYPLFYYSDISIPSELKASFSLIQKGMKYYQPMSDIILINSFYNTKKYTKKNMYYVGPILQEKVFDYVPSDKGYILVYLHKNLLKKYYPLFQKCIKKKFVVYVDTSSSIKTTEHITIKKISIENTFVEDLAHCTAVIGLAGLDLINEALYLEKPILALYEKGQVEQQINSHMVEEYSLGKRVENMQLAQEVLNSFLEKVVFMKKTIKQFKKDQYKVGNLEVYKYIHTLLEEKKE